MTTTRWNLPTLIDHTVLRPEATRTDVLRLCQEAKEHGFRVTTAIDAATGEVAGTVKVGGDGEQAIIGADGLIYVNSEDTAEVVVFDPKSLEVKKRFPIGVAKTPTGTSRCRTAT